MIEAGSGKETSVTVENSVHVLDIQKQHLTMEVIEQFDPVEMTIPEYSSVDPAQNTTQSIQRKNWKRMARGLQNIPAETNEYFEAKKQGKRHSRTDGPVVNGKKLKVINEEGIDLDPTTATDRHELSDLECTRAWDQRAIREFHLLLDESNPSLVFISETKLVEAQCNWWRRKFRLDGLFVVNSKRRSGGLVLLWREPFEVCIKSYSVGHIDCIISYGCKSWRFTGFYGSSVSALRHQSWQLLRRLAGMHELNSLPWLVGGDFNEILYDSEKGEGFQEM